MSKKVPGEDAYVDDSVHQGSARPGNGHYVYLQPTGSWGYSNAGLIIDSGESLLVDTLFDEDLTAEMLTTMKWQTNFGADEIKLVVNTHANGDHTFGNRLMKAASIIASEGTATEMAHDDPVMFDGMVKNAAALGPAGLFVAEKMEFNFAGVKLRQPDRRFSGELTLKVGDKDVQLIVVGPAHTEGDTLAYVPKDRVVYTGDIMFVEGTPIIWAGPIGNWVRACDRILAMDVECVVPGHGPVTDKSGVRAVKGYLEFIERETKARHAAGMSAWDAALDINLGTFGKWMDSERLAVSVDSIYRELNNDTSPRDLLGSLPDARNWKRSTYRGAGSAVAPVTRSRTTRGNSQGAAAVAWHPRSRCGRETHSLENPWHWASVPRALEFVLFGNCVHTGADKGARMKSCLGSVGQAPATALMQRRNICMDPIRLTATCFLKLLRTK